jgi:hypothetical protein
MLENVPLEFDYGSLEGFFQALCEVYKQNIASKSMIRYLRTKEEIRDQFINSILLILSGGREIVRMLTPYGTIPNIENESEITIESEKKYDAKEGEGSPTTDNLTQTKRNFEKDIRADIDKDIDENEDEDIDEYELEDDTPVIIKEYAVANLEKHEPISPIGFFKRIYTDFWGGSKSY